MGPEAYARHPENSLGPEGARESAQNPKKRQPPGLAENREMGGEDPDGEPPDDWLIQLGHDCVRRNPMLANTPDLSLMDHRNPWRRNAGAASAAR